MRLKNKHQNLDSRFRGNDIRNSFRHFVPMRLPWPTLGQAAFVPFPYNFTFPSINTFTSFPEIFRFSL